MEAHNNWSKIFEDQNSYLTHVEAQENSIRDDFKSQTAFPITKRNRPESPMIVFSV